jgi:hypothetical protein
MRFMIFVKANKESEQGVLPDEKILSAMSKYNEELSKAGVLLDLNGLHPSCKGMRVAFNGDKRTVIDGPFAESKELVAGYWLLQTKTREEVIEWIKRAPFQEGELEIRQVFELGDFPLTPEQKDSFDRVGSQLTKN